MLADPSILLRTLEAPGPGQAAVDRVIASPLKQGVRIFIVPQNLVELWVVATRPIERNGLGLTPAQATSEPQRIKIMFEMLPETAAIYPVREALVNTYGVSGKPAHDARLVAAMRIHGLKGALR